MAIPAALTEAGGDKILSLAYDASGDNAAAALSARKTRTLNGSVVGELDVYSTSGSLLHGNRNAVNTSQLCLSPSSASHPCQGLLVKAREGNANDVWVGMTGLTANTTEATGGWRLAPGASIGVPCRNVNEVFLRWATYTAGDGVEWIASAD